MTFVIYAIVSLQLIVQLNCQENNVCPTLEDYYTVKNNSKCWYDFSADSSVEEIVRKHGYPVETHRVTTVDGYILTVFRIPNSNSEGGSRKGAVFLQHGWLNSAAVFVARGRESLAFTLATAGYDVWLGNFRGSEYSQDHINLTVFDKQYWDYSADEIGLYDIPAQLDLVAQKGGHSKKIMYIGHSLGTTSALIYGSSFPKLARETVKLFILLAPAAYMSHMRSLFFRIFGPLFSIVLGLANNNNFIRLISQAEPMKKVTQLMCLESPILMKRCMQLLNLFVSGPRTQTAADMIPVLFNQIPSGTSFKVATHIADFTTNTFGRYNYGLRNFAKYGTVYPPKYNVSKIEVPVFIMYAVNDWACTKKDSLILYQKLPEKIKYGIHEISEPNFNHLDFVYGRDIKRLVNNHLVALMERINLV